MTHSGGLQDKHGMHATDLAACLQRLMASSGAGTREALWALQLLERKAAVARWRSGDLRSVVRIPRDRRQMRL